MATTRTRSPRVQYTNARQQGAPNPAVAVKPPTNLKSILKPVSSFIRVDYGGRDQNKVISDRLRAAGIVPTPATIAAYKLSAKQTRDGIAKRVEPRLTTANAYIG